MICSQLVKRYGGMDVLRGFTAEFPEGRTTAVMAASGAGKTTLLRILAGLEKPDGGELRGLSGRRLSMVFQEDRLCMGLGASANIRLANPGLTRQELREALAAVGLPADERPVSEYSGGMRRRAAILRAVLFDGDLLLLDEPFRGLDRDTRQKAVDYITAKWKGRTVILVTHDPEEPRLMGADSVIDMTEHERVWHKGEGQL
ncbi:ATP-binding cassette domain-containing protein [Lachnoclostridium sp. Marseille-P6806]|uniref:ATP-binding cassette domain-containing protein n=1 Tax=Lachnoclostridium sp. Marseille-P6806 TaxID=2364793 RepID=UPI00102FFCFE|nr:ATP-binding cassette domain-containing protein [Lachnoclostridium sp. Marseille-P6806]